MMYLLDFAEVEKKGKQFRIATFFDPTARRKVVVKFLTEKIKVPVEKLLTADDLLDFQPVEVLTDLQGEVKEIV